MADVIETYYTTSDKNANTLERCKNTLGREYWRIVLDYGKLGKEYVKISKKRALQSIEFGEFTLPVKHDKPLHCFFCKFMKRDMRQFVDRRFYCGQIPEEAPPRTKTIYDCNQVPDECPVEWKENN